MKKYMLINGLLLPKLFIRIEHQMKDIKFFSKLEKLIEKEIKVMLILLYVLNLREKNYISKISD